MPPSSVAVIVAMLNGGTAPRLLKKKFESETIPVGMAGLVAVGFGTVNPTGPILDPAASSWIARPLLAFATKNDSPGTTAIPQGSRRNGSVLFANPGTSEAKFVCR